MTDFIFRFCIFYSNISPIPITFSKYFTKYCCLLFSFVLPNLIKICLMMTRLMTNMYFNLGLFCWRIDANKKHTETKQKQIKILKIILTNENSKALFTKHCKGRKAKIRHFALWLIIKYINEVWLFENRFHYLFIFEIILRMTDMH